jgi:hypothetical protein
MTRMAMPLAAQLAQGWPFPVLNQPPDHRQGDREPNQIQPSGTHL